MASSTEEITYSNEGGIIPLTIRSETGNVLAFSEYNLQNNYVDNDLIQLAGVNSEEQEKLKELLKSWNCEYIFSKCVEECVDIESLKLFKLHHIQKLLNGFPLGYAVKFEHKLSEWQKSEASTVCSTLSEEDISISECENRMIDVKAIVEQSNYGLEITSHYKEAKKLTDTQRNFIVNNIIDFIVNKNIKMSTNLAKDISHQIVDVFKYEEISTYYHKIKGKHVTGKIYQKYFNKTKSLQNVGLKKKLPTSKSEDEPVDKARKLVSEENIEAHLESLNGNECTWSEIEDKWQKTSNYRLNDIQNIETTAEILAKWNHFGAPLGYKLVLIDFKTMFPAATDMLAFVDKFPGQMMEIYISKIKESAAKSMIEFLNADKITHNGKLLTTFYLLHYILVPTARTVSTINNEKKHKKYSIRDSQMAFVIVGNTVQQLEELIQRRIEENLPIQPLILVTGTIEDPKQISVLYDNIRYNLDCVARAIDVCFKLFHIFNLKYPVAANLFWSFLQQFFYNIEVNEIDQHSSIKSLINELKLSIN